MTTERLPPHDLAAEDAVTGSIIIDGGISNNPEEPTAMQVVAAIIRDPHDFYGQDREIYEAALTLHQRGDAVDQITIAEELERKQKLERLGGTSYIAHLMFVTPTSVNADYYANIVHKLAMQRQLMNVGAQIGNLAYDEDEADLNVSINKAKMLVSGLEQQVGRSYIESPLFTRRGENDYIVEWSKPGVAVEFTNLDVSGRTNIEVIHNNGHRHVLAMDTLNILRSSDMSYLVKDLQSKHSFPWREGLTVAKSLVMNDLREGEPAVEVDSNDADIEPPKYLVKPFVIKGYPNVVFGDPGAGKSLFEMLFTTIATLGWYDNPLRWEVEPGKSLRVLILDYETDEKTAKWTARCIQEGMNTGPITFHYRRCRLPLSQCVEQVERWIIETGADVIIIDSLGPAAGGNLSDTEPAFAFWAAQRRLKTTSLILAHCAKQAEDTGKARSIFGSQFYTAEARNVWELRKAAETGENAADFSLYHRKPPPFGKLHYPMGYHVEFGDVDCNGIAHKLVAEYKDPVTVESFKTSMPETARILDLLRTRARTNKEIAEELGMSSDNVRVNTNRLKEKGKIVKTPDGRWGLTYAGA